MFELLDKFSPGHLIGMVAVIGGVLGWIITHVASQWRRVRVAEIEGALKQQMLDRGLAATDIEQVLRASNRKNKNVCEGLGDGASSAKAAVVKALTEGGYEGQDIERTLRAFGQHPDVKAVEQKEGPDRAAAFRRAVSAKVGIVQMMAENGNSGEDIERVLVAFTDDAEWRMDRQAVPANV